MTRTDAERTRERGGPAVRCSQFGASLLPDCLGACQPGASASPRRSIARLALGLVVIFAAGVAAGLGAAGLVELLTALAAGGPTSVAWGLVLPLTVYSGSGDGAPGIVGAAAHVSARWPRRAGRRSTT